MRARGGARARRPRRSARSLSRRSCPAASSSASRSRAPSPSARTCCSATSRPARSTSPPASWCSRPSSASTASSARPRRSSRTTRRSPRWPTGSCRCPNGRIAAERRNAHRGRACGAGVVSAAARPQAAARPAQSPTGQARRHQPRDRGRRGDVHHVPQHVPVAATRPSRTYYERYRFAHVFAALTRAPLSVARSRRGDSRRSRGSRRGSSSTSRSTCRA